MITVDRSSNVPVYDQLVTQLRYQIAAGKYKVGETLPSTRELGKQLDVSFHTVRKAYQALEQEGLLTSRVGSGYRVEDRMPLPKAERMEQGAGVIQEALQRLIALGLTEQEIDYVFQEQFTFFDAVPQTRKLIAVAPYRELAEACARQIETVVQEEVEAVMPRHLHRHLDADYAFTPYPQLHAVAEELERTQVIGLDVHLHPDVLEPVARTLPHEMLGLVTRYPDAVQPLLSAVKAATGFKGQLAATALDAPGKQLTEFVRQTHLLLYTPACKRRLLPLLDRHRHVMIQYVISQPTLEAIKQVFSS